MFVSFGHSLTLPCHGAPSRDVDWWFQRYERTDWVLVAELHTRGFSSGNGFQGRVESFHLTEPGNYSLTLSPVVYSDLGIYKCQYYNDEIVLSDVKLEIRVPSNVSIAMGMSASLPCFANINSRARAGDLDILWKRGGEKVYQILKNTVTYGPGFENRASVSQEQALYGNMSLTIRQTRFSDEDDYQCFYNSPKERGNPDSASLVVTGHPPQNLTVKAGGLLSIPLYTADPVRVTFSAGLGSDEVLMLDANKGPARYGERCAQRCELLAQNYTLLLRSVTLEDAGVYKVTDPETKKTISSSAQSLCKSQLQLAARHCGWSESQTATHLALALEGPALQVLLDLDAAEQGDLKALTMALARHFGQRRSMQSSREKLNSRRREGKESWGTVAADVRLHIRQGYPSLDSAGQDELALYAFLQTLSSERLRQHIILTMPCSLDDAERAEDVLCLAPGQTTQPASAKETATRGRRKKSAGHAHPHNSGDSAHHQHDGAAAIAAIATAQHQHPSPDRHCCA
ncbi:hypothetical protein ANANG_G00280140 [Anguilla anguilla]|uniref:Ig-like domain-containing protein n=1 Tax=Anguilla anguilla TaxID=7936 RepID=A0A9D3LSD1_ANGAN|nr:hypothetical protein ANANG_G00280140 [Anguilla anguilla]